MVKIISQVRIGALRKEELDILFFGNNRLQNIKQRKLYGHITSVKAGQSADEWQAGELLFRVDLELAWPPRG